MILYEEGYFLLDDPVSEYLPQLAHMQVFSGVKNGELVLQDLTRPITIRDLLTHTAGLTYGIFGNTPVDSLVRTGNLWSGDLENMVDKLGEIPLLYQPGERWNYSLATDVLGYLVEVVSGQTFDRFLEERIFGPLGMDDTGFYVSGDKKDRVMQVYRLDSEGNLQTMGNRNVPGSPPALLSGGGGLFSTISDYARFCQMILNGGELDGARILGPKTIELMLINHLDTSELQGRRNSPGEGFGLGFSVILDLAETRSIGSEGAGGWAGIYNTYFTVDRDEDMFFILMTQFSPFAHYRIQDEFRVMVYQAIVE
jgi:CubicO group peptidase (beta-lactamase class C family)